MGVVRATVRHAEDGKLVQHFIFTATTLQLFYSDAGRRQLDRDGSSQGRTIPRSAVVGGGAPK